MKQHPFKVLVLLLLSILFMGCIKTRKDGHGSFSAKINGKDLLPRVPALTNGGPIETNANSYLSGRRRVSSSPMRLARM